MLTVEYFTFNPFQENTYVVYDDEKNCIIIDPGCSNNFENEELSAFISENQLNPSCIFLTHSHIDHVYGLDYVKSKYQVPIIGHALASKGIASTQLVAKLYGLNVVQPPDLDQTVDETDTVSIGKNVMRLLFCPGHSPDHLVLYNEENGIAIVGDVIFKESIGRSDLPGGNYETLMESIHQKILLLPSNTILYPGHGPETTIKQEITNNPFLK